MSRAEATIVINKPIDEVFEYTASPFNGPAFIPNLSENFNITPKDIGVGQTFDWRFNMAGVDLTGSAVVSEYQPPHKSVVTSTGDSKTTWIYTFEEVPEGTKVSAKVEYEIPQNILEKMSNDLILDKINQKTAEQMLENLKTILED